jgi:AraC family transcriptional regulator
MGGYLMEELISRVARELPIEMPVQTGIFYDKNTIIVRPNTFITNVETNFSDYHFSIPSVDPPTTKIGKKEYDFKANRAIVLNPEESIFVKKDTRDIPTKEYTALFINRKFLQEISYEVCGRTYVSFTNSNYTISNKMRFAFESFADEFKNFQPGNRLILESISTQITIELLRGLKSNIYDKIHEKKYGGVHHIIKVIEFMEEHYNSSISLDDLCKVANLSLYHFIRVFKEETGKTPHEYQIDIKIRKAEEILRRKHYSLKEIAQMCGFINQSHFCTVFKRKMGESASSYIKKI